MSIFVYTFAVFGLFHLVIDLAVGAFLWWFFRRSAEEREEMDIGVEKAEKRPYAICPGGHARPPAAHKLPNYAKASALAAVGHSHATPLSFLGSSSLGIICRVRIF
jgi:hypothetical protein